MGLYGLFGLYVYEWLFGIVGIGFDEGDIEGIVVFVDVFEVVEIVGVIIEEYV